MPYYRQRGSLPPVRHTVLRDESGALMYEELVGEEGFSSDSSLLYHRHVPSAIVSAREWSLPDQSVEANHPLIPRHLKLHSLFTPEAAAETDAVRGRRLLLGNDDVQIHYVWAGQTSPLYRNAVGDECVYVEAGEALLETPFGSIAATAGDYVVIPRTVAHRWVIEPGAVAQLYIVEARSHIGPARQYLSKHGQLLEHAPYCERDIRGPEGLCASDETDVDVYIKHRGLSGLVGSVHTVPHHPFDVVGWDGCLYPWAISIHAFMPITGKVHQPPPVHQIFEGDNFVICNFVPRKVDYHPSAVPVPYYHSNVDSDEIMFYVGGDYEARKGSGIGVGSVSVHPGGHSHGPQPGAMERSLGVEFFDELAVMVDTFRPLGLGEAARASDDGVYVQSWLRGSQR